MKKYNKPIIFDEIIEIEDIVANSPSDKPGEGGSGDLGDGEN